MKNWKLFVIPLILTVTICRTFLLYTNPESFLYNDSFHHAYLGILILFVIGLIYDIRKKINLIFFGIGLGLLIDEIFYFFSKGNQYQKYWNNLSTYGTATLVIVIIIIYFIAHHLKEKRIKSCA